MSGKKRLLFVIDSLEIGGAEKSLVTLLNLLDYSLYDVDLIRFSEGGEFEDLVPKGVEIHDIPHYFKYCTIHWGNIIQKVRRPVFLCSQIRYSLSLRLGRHNHGEAAVLLWKACHGCLDILSKEYDCAIAYAQGLPTFYVAEKVKAKKKIAWVNATYLPEGKYLKFIKSMYRDYDLVNGVSDTIKKLIIHTFNLPEEKVMVMKDMLDVDFARRMAGMPSSVEIDMTFEGVKILTVGRLSHMKGQDLALEAARKLKDVGFSFVWYLIGEGGLREHLEELVKRYGLENEFVLLGSRSNPYPYFNKCDIYVQPSRYEGFGITLAEAKMFGKPIVTTNFNSVEEQISNEENGLIVEVNAEGLFQGVKRLVQDNMLCQKLSRNVFNEKLDNLCELDKLMSWMNS